MMKEHLPTLALPYLLIVEIFHTSYTWIASESAEHGAWGAESVYAETAATIGAVTITTGDTVYRYHVSNAQDIEESNVNTGYDSDSVYRRVSAVLVDDSDRYVFYIDTSDDVHLISNDGGGWDDEGALQTGTYLRVIAEWGYNNENQAGEINYIFDNGVNVYYDSFALPAPPGAGRSFVVMIG